MERHQKHERNLIILCAVIALILLLSMSRHLFT